MPLGRWGATGILLKVNGVWCFSFSISQLEPGGKGLLINFAATGNHALPHILIMYTHTHTLVYVQRVYALLYTQYRTQ